MTDMTKQAQQVISAGDVAGTAVYGANKEKLGTVNAVMLGKRDGKVHHAILSIGGFLGMGDKLHSTPWSKLDYDTDLEEYRLDVPKIGSGMHLRSTSQTAPWRLIVNFRTSPTTIIVETTLCSRSRTGKTEVGCDPYKIMGTCLDCD